MEKEQIKEVLNKHLGKGYVGDVYTIRNYIVSSHDGDGTTEFIKVRLSTHKGYYINDSQAKAIEEELEDYLMNKYQHDDVYAIASNVFNTLLVISLSY